MTIKENPKRDVFTRRNVTERKEARRRTSNSIKTPCFTFYSFFLYCSSSCCCCCCCCCWVLCALSLKCISVSSRPLNKYLLIIHNYFVSLCVCLWMATSSRTRTTTHTMTMIKDVICQKFLDSEIWSFYELLLLLLIAGGVYVLVIHTMMMAGALYCCCCCCYSCCCWSTLPTSTAVFPAHLSLMVLPKTFHQISLVGAYIKYK